MAADNRGKIMKHWKALVTITVEVDMTNIPDDWDDPYGIEELAEDSVDIRASSGYEVEVVRVMTDRVWEVKQ